jgi:tRNA(fMet)-specific endonuclease VapC
MLFLLDTNAVSDILREHPTVVARVGRLSVSDQLATCTIVQGELLFGMERLPPGKRRDELDRKLRSILAGLRCEPVAESAADQYARAKRACQTKGLPLDENDLWIAATSLALGAVLVTRDTDFGPIDGLRTENWTV